MAERYMPIEEFQSAGFLQEVNRRVLHACGLALTVTVPGPEFETKVRNNIMTFLDRSVDEEDLRHLLCDYIIQALGSYGVFEARIVGVQDYRDDPEGMAFGQQRDDGTFEPWSDYPHEEAVTKARTVDREIDKHRAARNELFGSVVQPLPRIREYDDPSKPGRLDANGVEWWACDPYPTWYRRGEDDKVIVPGEEPEWVD